MIELSAQKAAIEAVGAASVAADGYVITEVDGQRVATRTSLLTSLEVAQLTARYRALADGSATPIKANRKGLCSKCAYAQRCQPEILSGH